MPKHYTTSHILDMLAGHERRKRRAIRSRLSQLRLGYVNRERPVDPILIEGTHWHRIGEGPRSETVYTPAGLKEIEKIFNQPK